MTFYINTYFDPSILDTKFFKLKIQAVLIRVISKKHI